MSEGPIIQAMVWYKEEDWEKLMDIFSDAHLLPKSYGEWLQKAEAMVQQIQAEGDKVVKVFIDPDTFPEWCEKKGKKTDAESRTELAIEVISARNISI